MVRTCHAICFVSTWSNFRACGRRKLSGRDHSNASASAVQFSHLSSGTICVECRTNCRVCGRNPIGWPFKLNLLSFIHFRNEIVCFPVLVVTVKSRLSVSVEHVYCNSMTVLKGADWNKMKANEQYFSVVLFLLCCKRWWIRGVIYYSVTIP